MYSLFDSQYLWNKVTCSYNSCAERVIICVRIDHHQRLSRCHRTAERTTAVSVSGVMAAHDASMVSRVAGFCR
jgi:hypothetical protein